jgi:hypothetical protein
MFAGTCADNYLSASAGTLTHMMEPDGEKKPSRHAWHGVAALRSWSQRPAAQSSHTAGCQIPSGLR